MIRIRRVVLVLNDAKFTSTHIYIPKFKYIYIQTLYTYIY